MRRDVARRWLCAALLGFLVVGSACASSDDARDLEARASAPTTTAASGTGTGDSTARPTAPEGGTDAYPSPSGVVTEGSTAPPTAQPTTEPAASGGFHPPSLSDPNNNRPLAARITPSCAERGTTITFEIRFAAGGTLAAHVKFPNEQFSDLPSSRGKVPANGVYVWKLEIPSDAGAGVAKLSVAATTADGGHASGQFDFKVAAAGGC